MTTIEKIKAPIEQELKEFEPYFKKSLQFAGSDFSEKKLIYMNQFLGNSYFEKNHFDSALVYFNYLKSADSLNSGNFINSAVCNYKINNKQNVRRELCNIK